MARAFSSERSPQQPDSTERHSKEAADRVDGQPFGTHRDHGGTDGKAHHRG